MFLDWFLRLSRSPGVQATNQKMVGWDHWKPLPLAFCPNIILEQFDDNYATPLLWGRRDVHEDDYHFGDNSTLSSTDAVYHELPPVQKFALRHDIKEIVRSDGQIQNVGIFVESFELYMIRLKLYHFIVSKCLFRLSIRRYQLCDVMDISWFLITSLL